MTESLDLFDAIINSRWFLRMSVILLLNKIDIFRERLPKVGDWRFFLSFFTAVQSVPRYHWNNTSKSTRVGRTWTRPPSTSFGGLCKRTGRSSIYTPSECLRQRSDHTLIVRYSITQATDTLDTRLISAAVTDTIRSNRLKDVDIL